MLGLLREVGSVSHRLYSRNQRRSRLQQPKQQLWMKSLNVGKRGRAGKKWMMRKPKTWTLMSRP
eukprot:53735-Eustigmatos_ZCMA.PRE.1